jgi:hypothetical protein
MAKDDPEETKAKAPKEPQFKIKMPPAPKVPPVPKGKPSARKMPTIKIKKGKAGKK